MSEIEVRLPSHVKVASIGPMVERACAGEGLTRSAEGTLARYPGSIHWHFKMAKQPGTLEVTWWPAAGRLWFKVAANRTGPWMEEKLARIKAQLERSS